MKSVTVHGDMLITYIDYKDVLWAENYRTDREAVAKAIKSANDEAEKALLQKYLDSIIESEKTDTGCMGLYILVLQVEKNNDGK